jgi:intracellular multiplication protein IcmD
MVKNYIDYFSNYLRKILIAMVVLMSYPTQAAEKNLGDIAAGITKSFAGLAQFITAFAYMGGLGFVLASILKFKAHKDNPAQIPIGTPVMLLGVGASLMFLPYIFGLAGQTVFGTSAGQGGLSGVTSFNF